MRETMRRVQAYLGQWEHLSGREFQDPDRRRTALYEGYCKALMRVCLNKGISSTVTRSMGGQEITWMELPDDSQLQMTDGPALHGKSFWEFDLRGFLRYGIPFQRIAFGIQDGIGSFFLHHRTGGVGN